MDTLENSDFAKSGIRQTVYAVAFFMSSSQHGAIALVDVHLCCKGLMELHRGLCATYCTGFS